MLAISKTIPQVLAKPASTVICCKRFIKDGELYTLSPPPPVTNRTMGPYPRTKEEREKAAKKYNLIPEDYEPYPEDYGFGDYPKLPAVGAYNRYKYDDFDDPQDRRFYGEPFHLDADLYQYERIDPMKYDKIAMHQFPMWKRYIVCLGAPVLVAGLYYILGATKININHPWKIRDFNHGRPQYAFPPSASDHDDHGHH